MKIKRAALIAGVVLGTAFVAPQAAQADVNTVFHYGTNIQPPVWVLEYGGAVYKVYPGQCTPGDVSIKAVKPANGTTMFFHQSTAGDKSYRKSGVVPPVDWWNCLGNDISAYKTRYGS